MTHKYVKYVFYIYSLFFIQNYDVFLKKLENIHLCFSLSCIICTL